jgi:hypothetical protein
MASIPRVALNIVGPSSGLLTGAAVASSPPSVESERDHLTTIYVAPRAWMAPLAGGLSLPPKWPSAKSPGLNQRHDGAARVDSAQRGS